MPTSVYRYSFSDRFRFDNNNLMVVSGLHNVADKRRFTQPFAGFINSRHTIQVMNVQSLQKWSFLNVLLLKKSHAAYIMYIPGYMVGLHCYAE